ncbi:fungal-specific transcription factor domain-containing protein [Mycena vulgaris]|nr:fungal-specific transcription factor domain-containing protein [Mycena vulgaris]
MAWPPGAPAYTLPFAATLDRLAVPGDYDSDQEQDDLPSKTGKPVRRRSSKACDQCRKSKCKCERGTGDACRSCMLLGTECTFLGPSRKRGPPKGYIDAIEARLHQTEALVGILLAAAGRGEARAGGVLRDLGEDPLARAILARIDSSAYGPAGRGASSSSASSSNNNNNNSNNNSRNSSAHSTPPPTPVSAHPNAKGRAPGAINGGAALDIGSTQCFDASASGHAPGYYARANGSGHANGGNGQGQGPRRPAIITALGSSGGLHPLSAGGHPMSTGGGHQMSAHPLPAHAHPHMAPPPLSAGADGRRLRRRVEVPSGYRDDAQASPSSAYASDEDRELDLDVDADAGRGGGGGEGGRLARAVGQLSLNEERVVRYHGKASGLHFLGGDEDGEVGRNVGGIWRFPKARVWPAAPAGWVDAESGAGDGAEGLPPRAVQEALLARYFVHVHPGFPVVHKEAFGWEEGTGWGEGCVTFFILFIRSSLPFLNPPHAPPLLLLAMYALAARHAPAPAPSPGAHAMWPAGDAFLFRAKVLLDSSYAASRASTCQALLLMGYREIGIGAMAQAWIYIGMAVRMAQDLGMQRDADGWVRGKGKEGKLFGPWEIAERRRIWYACVIMDKYVSTYIGRPLAIFERDFDTSLPSESDAEEMAEYALVGGAPRAGRVISCFNASARLGAILSQIVQSIYALRPACSRHAEQLVLDGQLEKWLLALPAHLRHDSGARGGEVPLPQVLTLHMQYCIRQSAGRSKHSPAPEDGDVRGSAEKSYELCAGAANHITTIATLYSETYTLKHCAVFLCYYLFTASIMHVTSLSAYPTDPQARMGLTKCMDALKEMEVVWPSAARALELLRGAEATLAAADANTNGNASALASDAVRAHKRSASSQLVDDSFAVPPAESGFLAIRPYGAPVYQANGHYGGVGVGAGSAPRSPAYYAPPPPASYERWPTEGAPGGGMVAFQGALSTAVMGPAYSTGLVDDGHANGHARQQRVVGHEGEPRYAQQQQQQQQQYWSDYAPFPAYVAMQDPAGLTHATEPQMYPMHDQYNMYTQ